MTMRRPAVELLLWTAVFAGVGSCREPTAGGNTLVPRWRAELRYGTALTPAPVQSGSSVIALAGSVVVSYDASSGALQWHSDSTASHPRIGGGANIAVRGSLAVAGNVDLAGIDLNTHAVRWRAVPSSVVPFSNVLLDSARAYSGGMNAEIQAWDASTGVLVWTTSLSSVCPFTCMIRGLTFVGDTVLAVVQKSVDGFTGHTEAVVVALGSGTGQVLWSWQSSTGSRRAASSAATVAGNLLLMSDFSSNFYAFDRATRQEIWTVFAPGHPIGPAEGPLVSGDTVYAADLGGNVYAVNLATGNQLWRQNVGTGVTSIQLCNGRLFLQNFSLIALRASDGAIVGSFRAPDGLFASRIGKGSDAVYVASDLSLYAFPCQ